MRYQKKPIVGQLLHGHWTLQLQELCHHLVQQVLHQPGATVGPDDGEDDGHGWSCVAGSYDLTTLLQSMSSQ